MSWILIISFVAYADRGVALTNIPNFKTEQECIIAGKKSASLASSYSNVNFVCITQSK